MNKRAKINPIEDVYTPFNYQLVAKEKNIPIKCSQYCVTVAFGIPAEEEECPLTLDSIAESKLSFLPDTPFLLDRPKHCKVTLPCGHSFSALTLMYNFCKNYMTCPCCRAGKQVRMDVLCLPKHLRSDFKNHLQRVTHEEREQEARIAGFVYVLTYSHLADNDNLELMMEFYNNNNASTLSSENSPIYTMTTRLQANGSNISTFLEPRTDLRGISNVAHMGVNAIRLSMHLFMPRTGRVVIDSTAITPLPQVGEGMSPAVLTIPGTTATATADHDGFDFIIRLNDNNVNSTRFSVFLLQSASSPHLSIRGINWHPGTETLMITSSSV